MENQNDSVNLVDLFDEEGNKTTFEHLDTVEQGEKVYIVCCRHDVPEDEEVDVIILEVVKDENGEECLELIEDELILDNVYDAFKERNFENFEFED